MRSKYGSMPVLTPSASQEPSPRSCTYSRCREWASVRLGVLPIASRPGTSDMLANLSHVLSQRHRGVDLPLECGSVWDQGRLKESQKIPLRYVADQSSRESSHWKRPESSWSGVHHIMMITLVPGFQFIRRFRLVVSCNHHTCHSSAYAAGNTTGFSSVPSFHVSKFGMAPQVAMPAR